MIQQSQIDSIHRPRPFLTADWRYLVMLNYQVDPKVLLPLVPSGTELDQFQGNTYVSVVGFLFLNTKVLGLPIPFHRNFEEINLRFYVVRKKHGEWRRGVVFVKEIVPRAAIALTARILYGENYVAMPTRHRNEFSIPENSQSASFSYQWRHQGRWNTVSAKVEGPPSTLQPASEQEFIAEHYWGYTARGKNHSIEYRVGHPPWKVWQAHDAVLDVDVASLYGPEFCEALNANPTSAFVAEGSAIEVYAGHKVSD